VLLPKRRDKLVHYHDIKNHDYYNHDDNDDYKNDDNDYENNNDNTHDHDTTTFRRHHHRSHVHGRNQDTGLLAD
jgi:hypothetical protein